MAFLDRLSTRLAEALPGGAPLRLERPRASLCFDDFPRSAWATGGPILAAARACARASIPPGASAAASPRGTTSSPPPTCARCATPATRSAAIASRTAPRPGWRSEPSMRTSSATPPSCATRRAWLPPPSPIPTACISPASMAVTARRFRGARRVRGGVNAGPARSPPHRRRAPGGALMDGGGTGGGGGAGGAAAGLAGALHPRRLAHADPLRLHAADAGARAGDAGARRGRGHAGGRGAGSARDGRRQRFGGSAHETSQRLLRGRLAGEDRDGDRRGARSCPGSTTSDRTTRTSAAAPPSRSGRPRRPRSRARTGR